ncbi:MAG TPA: MerR family transcriptional regulator [Candidatus Binatia bacterium]|nr:MerR family transcriptional regulator [Candidatus Binatia bacterium]
MRAAKPQIPDKLYFKIGEVADIVGVKPYVLRYWETEFSILKPGKTRSKHRLYRRRDIETVLEIKRLLHQERFTIEGAKKRLRTQQSEQREQKAPKEQMALPLGERTYRNALIRVKKDLESLYKLLR